MDKILLELVQKFNCDGVLAASVLASLARINLDYTSGLEKTFSQLDLKQVESEEEAFNMGSFFGTLYNLNKMETSMFAYLRLSAEIAKDVPFLLPFLKGVFQVLHFLCQTFPS